jgi:hypothetical protein
MRSLPNNIIIETAMKIAAPFKAKISAQAAICLQTGQSLPVQ